MKFTRQDFTKTRKSILLFFGALMLMTSIVYYAQLKRERSQQALENQKIILQQAIQRYQSSGTEKNNIIKYLPEYQKLISNGLLGEEQRLAWVDALRNIHKSEKLFTIKYNIGAQERYEPAYKLNLGSFKITRSTMQLELAMLHEGDLLTLLDGLGTQQTSPFIVRKCLMTRINVNTGSSLTPRMQAKCELDWITIHEPIAPSTLVPAPNKAELEAL